MARKKKPPKIKLPRKIKKGDIINVAVQPKYPSITGLATIGDTDDFYRKEPAVYLKEMEVFYAWKWGNTPDQEREIVKGMILQSLGLSKIKEKENGK